MVPVLAGAVESGETAEQIAFFETKIRPVLIESCYQCHSTEGDKVKGGLLVDSRDGLRRGGDSGHAVVPGDLEASLLWTAVSYEDDDYAMPPKQKLPESAIEDIRRWILMGAPDPRVSEAVMVQAGIDVEAGKAFWSFQKPERPVRPELEDGSWARSDIDQFILAGLENAGLKPVEDAEATALLRRVSFDLVGLPPSPQQVKAFLEGWKEDPQAVMARTVDELLASPQFGERWGRHWLDVARYAESSGKEVNVTYPHAWRYRDYVIDSFNADKPYDRFLIEQIAGDLLPIKDDADWQENLIATGFLALGAKSLNEQDPFKFRMDLVDEQIDAVTQSMMGLTVACARCHDHKFDPIPTTDYYALAGIFLSTESYYGTVQQLQNRRSTDLLILPIEDEVHAQAALSGEQMAGMREQVGRLEEELAEIRRRGFEQRRAGGEEANNAALLLQSIRVSAQLNALKAQLEGVDETGQPKTFAMGVQEASQKRDATVLIRGEVDKPAQVVPRGFVQVVQHAETPVIGPDSSGRLELAQWIASEENPLTARVMANRIWQHLMGVGLVGTPDNFGVTGQAPTHPELLDYLAVEFVEGGWSVKALIREIVLSRTYQLSSAFDAENYAVDPDNATYWRANPRRLDAEALRDAMLAASGTLDLERPLGSVVAQVGDAVLGLRVGEAQLNRPGNFRSVYLPIARDMLPEALALFDFAEPSMVMGVRETTNVPLQALYLMNDEFVTEQATAFGRLLLERFDTPRERVGYAFLQTFGRLATEAEIQSCIRFFARFMPAAGAELRNRGAAEALALATFCQALFGSAEFRYLN